VLFLGFEHSSPSTQLGKTAVGQPPHQYVSAHRLERAKEMLMRGDQSLLDIAIALNFSS